MDSKDKETVTQKRYVEVLEHNGWEGETWHFWHPIYITAEHTEKKWNLLLKTVRKRLQEIFHGTDTRWELRTTLVKKKGVEFLIKRPSGTSYMQEHNWDSPFDFESLTRFSQCSSEKCAESEREFCYKGEHYFTCTCDGEEEEEEEEEERVVDDPQ
jgi:hypothetical protein